MDAHKAIQKSREILAAEGQFALSEAILDYHNFAAFAEQAAYAVKQWSNQKRGASPWLRDYAVELRRLYENFAKLREADPMLCYKPAHDVAAAFHKSQAPRRYFRTGNRCGKTTTAYAEHYYVTTAQHPWRRIDPTDRNSTFIVAGLPFNKYAPDVFEKKFFEKEENSPISPMIPENGKWFCHYDSKNRILTIGCPECAAKGRAKHCPSYHARQTISLMNAENGIGVFEAFAARMGHIDEHIEQKFYNAIQQRLASAKGSFLLITGTPLHGEESWETQLLARVAKGESEDIPNLADPLKPNSGPLVDMFEIDQYAAGIVPHDEIRRISSTYDRAEVEARVYGRPVPLAENPVFDRAKLTVWRDTQAKTPVFVQLLPKKPLLEVMSGEDVEIVPMPHANEAKRVDAHRIWELPKAGEQYIMGIDVAAGLAPGRVGRIADASVCSVLKLTLDASSLTIRADMVAQYWGYANPLDYAVEIYKLGTLYNNATAIIELTGGLGRAVMIELKDKLAYIGLYRPPSPPESAMANMEGRFGVETSATSKPTMVAALQKYINQDLLTLRCADTIRELSHFEQIRTSAQGLELSTPRYKGASGAKDDRVMSLAIAIGTLVANPLIFDFGEVHAKLYQGAGEDNAALFDTLRSDDEQAQENTLRAFGVFEDGPEEF